MVSLIRGDEMGNKPCVYKMENLINNKVYIGQTTQGLNKRKTGHLSGLRNNYYRNIHVKKDYELYGEKVFDFQVIEYCDIEDLERKEIEWIKIYKSNTREHGYNIESGGNKGKKMPEEAINRMLENKDYSTIVGASNKRARKIICVNDGRIFNCMKHASQYYKVPYAGVIRSCSGARVSCYSEDGNWYQFRYFEEGKEYKLEEQKKLKPSKKKKVKCLNTGEIFGSVRKAAESTGIYRSFITSICNGELEEREGMKFEYVYE